MRMQEFRTVPRPPDWPLLWIAIAGGFGLGVAVAWAVLR